MRILIFDPFHGAAGDMITGALLDCGADRDLVLRAMQSVVANPGLLLSPGAVSVQLKSIPTHPPPTGHLPK